VERGYLTQDVWHFGPYNFGPVPFRPSPKSTNQFGHTITFSVPFLLIFFKLLKLMFKIMLKVCFSHRKFKHLKELGLGPSYIELILVLRHAAVNYYL
jgi:hypothetical protein